jgi:hypothetical protein
MRIRVKDVLDLLASGALWEEILQDFPLLDDGNPGAVNRNVKRQSGKQHPRISW